MNLRFAFIRISGVIITLFTSAVLYGQSVVVTATIGTLNSSYFTVKDAFDNINNGNHQGDISILIGSVYGEVITETSQAIINKSGSGAANYNSIIINPGASNVTIRGNISGSCCVPSGVIKLNQAENITIDGRINSSGSTLDLTIENTNVGSYSSSFVFFAASNNVLKYTTVKSSVSGSCCGAGTVSITDNNTGGGSGSSNNLVEYCNITKSGSTLPRRAIYGKGASGRENTNNTIRNCTISEFQEYGIYLGNSTSGEGYNRNWIIEDNRIFQETNFTSMSFSQIGICIGVPFSASYGELGSFIVRGNDIGGNGSGGDWTCASTSSSYRVAGISINSSTTIYSYIDSNIIHNFDIRTTNTATDYGMFSGIVVSNGKVAIGSQYGNVIGSLNDPSLGIKVARNNSSHGGFVSGIQVRSSSDLQNIINNNQIGSFSLLAGVGNFTYFYGIKNASSTTYPRDSVFRNNISYCDINKANYVRVIEAQGLIAKNRVRDINYNGPASFSELVGIKWYGGQVVSPDARGVENNEVILGKNSIGASIAQNELIIGIDIYRGDANINHNSVLIEGSSTGSDNTYAIRLPNTGTINFRNNLMYNERIGGSGKHYAIEKTGLGVAFNSNNNAFVIATGVNNVLGVWSGTDRQLLTDWSSSSGDVNSISDNNVNQPNTTLFPYLAQDSLDVNSPSWLQAGISSFIVDDIAFRPRDLSVPTIGAYEAVDPLPVELLYFMGEKENRRNRLYWKTVSENQSMLFIVEKSNDILNWENVVTMNAAGFSDSEIYYETYDVNPYQLTYYRLIQVDFDGKRHHSKIISIGNQISVGVYPNPFYDNIMISIEDDQIEDLEIDIFDNTGKTVFHGNIENKGINRVDVSNVQASGMYLISVKSNGVQLLMERIVKH